MKYEILVRVEIALSYDGSLNPDSQTSLILRLQQDYGMITHMEPTHFESLFPDDTRFDEIEKILSFVKTGKSCQLVGLPGVGRANLLNMLAYNRNIRQKHLEDNQKWFHFVLINCSEIKKRNLFEATKFFFLELVDSLADRGMDDLHEKTKAILKDSLQLKDEQVLFQGFKRAIDYLCIEKELTIVLLLDRFEQYIPQLSSEFFTHLRALRDRAKYRFSAVFSLSRPLEDQVEKEIFSDFSDSVANHVIYMQLYDKPAIDFRIAYIEKVQGKKLDPLIFKQILSATAGHGKLMNLATEALLNKNQESGIKGQGLETFLLEQKSIQTILSEIWQVLTPSEQQAIVILSKAKNLGDPSAQPQDDMGKTFLEKVHLIKNQAIQIPLFEKFVKQQTDTPTLQGQKSQTITYNSEANEIIKGSDVLSDKLTASEFRLLRFLLQNQGKVIEREELISAIWKTQASTAGVTEQALDQLIFRLRRKIENDPNNPKFLQTIKGRGLRFIQ